MPVWLPPPQGPGYEAPRRRIHGVAPTPRPLGGTLRGAIRTTTTGRYEASQFGGIEQMNDTMPQTGPLLVSRSKAMEMLDVRDGRVMNRLR